MAWVKHSLQCGRIIFRQYHLCRDKQYQMARKEKSLILKIFAILCTFVMVSSCTQNDTPETIPDPNIYKIDSVFREFYDYMGGEALLGQSISAAKYENGKTYQYTTNSLLIFDSQAPEARKFQFGAVGKQFGINPPPNSDYVVAEPFQDIYEQLGAIFIGKPISGLVFNAENNHHEQYFENLGFYIDSTSSNSVRLLPYGVWACGEECSDSLNPKNTNEALAPVLPSPTPAPVDQSPINISLTPITPSRWVIQLWEKMPTIPADQKQEIGINVTQDGSPKEGLQAKLMIELPNGMAINTAFPETDQKGNAYLEINALDALLLESKTTENPVPQATNGILIPYEVCIPSLIGDEFCVQSSYLIWDNP